jgi:hypothetical protein
MTWMGVRQVSSWWECGVFQRWLHGRGCVGTYEEVVWGTEGISSSSSSSLEAAPAGGGGHPRGCMVLTVARLRLRCFCKGNTLGNLGVVNSM